MFLYHRVPENMQGTVLYPLNQLKDTMPDIFAQHDAKYSWRREVKDTIIPGLGKWNDVIHLSPIDPNETLAALKSAGFSLEHKWRMFEIDPLTLDQSKLVIMKKNHEGKTPRAQYEGFSLDALKKVTHLSPWTLQYYKECKQKGIEPLLYPGSPHVFYMGTIETKELSIVEYN